MAVPGLYPLLFPPNGYHGQVQWLANSSAALGPESYSILLSASKEGKIVLPKYISLKTSSGNIINIGETLTTPNSKKVKRTPLLSVYSSDSCHEVTHASTMANLWQSQLGRKGAKEEEDQEGQGERIVEGEGEGEAQDEEGMLEVLEKEKDEEKVRHEQFSRKVHVELSECVLSKSELLAHFSNYGEVEDLLMPSNADGQAEVVFKTVGSALHCLNLDHRLSQDSSNASPVRLRLRGGNAPTPPPPRQLQRNVNPFR